MKAYRTLALATAMVTCLAGSALAVTPKTESVVSQDRITLGDVFDGVKDNADYYLAPAPEAGKTTVLNVNDLVRISDAFNLGWTPGGRPQQVVIRRPASEKQLSASAARPAADASVIDHYDVEAALQDHFLQELKGQKFDMELSDRGIRFRVPAGTGKDIRIDNVSYDAPKGEFKALASVAALPETKREVRGRIFLISQVPVLKEPLRPGDIISTSDIDYVDMRAKDITATMVVDADKLAGLTPRRGISAMKPIVASDVQLPKLVKKGDLVTMALENGVISLTTQGRAMSDGAEGDVIAVMNASSKQVVDAKVTGPQNVRVRPPVDILSMN